MGKIAIINQRYGPEVNGGSEYYTRLLAEHLCGDYEIEVLTTTALDYATWENVYSTGVEHMGGVAVRRFAVRHSRNMLRFRVVNKLHRILAKVGIHPDRWWLREQGPDCPELIRYLRENQGEYDLFIFVTYLYYTTAMGLPEVAEKAVLIPTAHDEPYIYYPVYRPVFTKPQGILYLTEEEKAFVERTFHNEKIPNAVVGVGIEIPADYQQQSKREQCIREFRDKYQIHRDYLIYVGRVDVGKNCEEMFDFFLRYLAEHPETEMELVVMGKAAMPVPEHPAIRYLGFVSETEKYAGIAGARYLWLPSEFESLSISLLEGMALGTPGLVNGNCAVLRGHCDKSGAAFAYRNWKEFAQLLTSVWNYDIINANAFILGESPILRGAQKTVRCRDDIINANAFILGESSILRDAQDEQSARDILRERAQKYIRENYTWERVLDRVREVLHEVEQRRKEQEER